MIRRRRVAATRGLVLLCLLVAGLASTARAHTDIELQIAETNRQLAAEPGNAALLLKRGDLQRRHIDYEAAAADFAAARALDPNLALIDFYEGRLALEQGQAARANALLTAYLESSSGHAAAWVLRGKALMLIGRDDAAAGDFETAIGLSESPGPDLYRMNVIALLRAGRPTDALARVDAGLANLPGEVNLLGLGTDIALAENQPTLAQAYLASLPAGLFRVERWAARQARAECLEGEALVRREQCLGEAQEALELLLSTSPG